MVIYKKKKKKKKEEEEEEERKKERRHINVSSERVNMQLNAFFTMISCLMHKHKYDPNDKPQIF